MNTLMTNETKVIGNNKCTSSLPYLIYILFEATEKILTFSCQVSLGAHKAKKSLAG